MHFYCVFIYPVFSPFVADHWNRYQALLFFRFCKAITRSIRQTWVKQFPVSESCTDKELRMETICSASLRWIKREESTWCSRPLQLYNRQEEGTNEKDELTYWLNAQEINCSRKFHSKRILICCAYFLTPTTPEISAAHLSINWRLDRCQWMQSKPALLISWTFPSKCTFYSCFLDIHIKRHPHLLKPYFNRKTGNEFKLHMFWLNPAWMQTPFYLLKKKGISFCETRQEIGFNASGTQRRVGGTTLSSCPVPVISGIIGILFSRNEQMWIY